MQIVEPQKNPGIVRVGFNLMWSSIALGQMLQLPLLEMPLRTRKQQHRPQVWDIIRRRWVALTPEEHVRQCLLGWLIEKCGYPAPLISVERGLHFGHTMLRYDALIYQRDTTLPWMLVECKAPDVAISEEVLQQALRYVGKLPGCRYWLLSNGHQSFCAMGAGSEGIQWLSSLPAYEH
ncbi:MAG: type I restriction enzyme HsdR N-terminal domain-containing protein [Bacteroidetes bacterium]|nr:type I restriction enzyme HsdR N-terminal domain-containing protein [Bacteroidota bacterium]MBS1629666.1 type I restriction enzyme HsdR N-terminal domain-containing protein [Bacteroidota bacterium]